MPERGLVIAGEVVPGTEWIRRGPFFGPGDRGVRPRAAVMKQLVGHWTAGEAGLKDPDGPGPLTEYDDDAARVVAVLRGRTIDGRPIHAGIHFVIAACAPDDPEADVWQTGDPGKYALVHVGNRLVYRQSIGVEVVNCGFPSYKGQNRNFRNRPVSTVQFAGFRRDVCAFYPGQLAAWVRLAETLAALDGRAGIAIPRQVPTELGRRFTPAEARRWAGALEHHLVPGTRKLDAAGQLLAALAEAGWRVRAP